MIVFFLQKQDVCTSNNQNNFQKKEQRSSSSSPFLKNNNLINMRRIFRGRLGRSRSKGGLIGKFIYYLLKTNKCDV